MSLDKSEWLEKCESKTSGPSRKDRLEPLESIDAVLAWGLGGASTVANEQTPFPFHSRLLFDKIASVFREAACSDLPHARRGQKARPGGPLCKHVHGYECGPNLQRGICQ
jgi:hypothetical protein